MLPHSPAGMALGGGPDGLGISGIGIGLGVSLTAGDGPPTGNGSLFSGAKNQNRKPPTANSRAKPIKKEFAVGFLSLIVVIITVIIIGHKAVVWNLDQKKSRPEAA